MMLPSELGLVSLFPHSDLSNREIFHSALTLSNPSRLDQFVSLGIKVLVYSSDRAVAGVSDHTDLLCRLWGAKEMRGHVDARSRNGDRRASSKIIEGDSLLTECHGDLDETWSFEI